MAFQANRPLLSGVVRSQTMASPFIVIEQGAPHIEDQLTIPRPNRLGVIRRFWEDMRAFDGHSEYRLSVSDVPNLGSVARFLAYTVYNPHVPLTCEWVVSGRYESKSILTLVGAGLEHDDDIIQQWFDANQVMKLLGAADSFATMVLAVRCICGAHESDVEAEQFVGRVLGRDWCPE